MKRHWLYELREPGAHVESGGCSRCLEIKGLDGQLRNCVLLIGINSARFAILVD